ncbi:hypothetical protein CASFOL_034732 [Castilleja foliolosa]|uniref:RNase H type-1 domain-containing protein n=1 Tax=Castilleja foliolosa TaxID=1961234 RepID=A0ABD3BQW0_9LAMI
MILDMNNKLFLSPLCKTEFLVFTIVLWDMICYSRNLISHGYVALTIQDMASLVSRKTKAHWLSISKTLLLRSSPNQSWVPPQAGWIKINMDASFVDGVAFTGAVIRNMDDSILLASTSKHNCLDPNHSRVFGSQRCL